MSKEHTSSPEMNRRIFLRRLGAAAGAVALGGIGYEVDSLATGGGSKAGGPSSAGRGAGRSTTSTSLPPTTTTVPPGVVPDLPTAEWLVEENSRPGSLGWTGVGTSFQGQLEGFADRTSATRGDVVTLYVNTQSPKVMVEIYRMGWYGGYGGRLVHTTAWERGVTQPASDFTSGVNTVECHWSATASFEIGSDWPPGNYLLRLVGSDDVAEWVPLTIRDDTSTAAILVQNSVTTWQAYNLWGGYSLYYGQDPGGGQSYDSRARVVSFDRPYTHNWAAGVADWLGDEFPLVMLAEKHGLDLAYATDVDVHQHPEWLRNHRCLVSLGHDEYWSETMRSGALAAVESGVNFAFLGANACYRHIRFEASPLGPDRHEVCYKDGTEDPLNGVDDAEVTWNWEDGPDPRPESTLIGAMYQSYLASGPIVVADPSSWLLRGTGLAKGDKLPDVIGSEFDGYVPTMPGPRDLSLVFHSPTQSVSGAGYSDVTWYTVPGGGGVFASGSSAYVAKLSANEGRLPSYVLADVPGVTEPLTKMTLNLLSVIGEGPASRSFPSHANWEQFYPSSWVGVASNDV